MSTDTGEAPVLELREYRVRKFVPEVRLDVDFPVGINVLLGVNGVGKTTILRSLVRPDLRTNNARVGLRRGSRRSELEHERVCLLPQRPVLPSQMTVSDLVRYCCQVRGAPPAAARKMLELLDLSELEDRRVRHLSGGETQRLNLALAFAGRPGVTLLDEPTVALDPLARTRFASALRSVAVPDVVVLMSTHVASDIEIADRVFVIDHRGVTWQGDPESFLAHAPDNRFDTAFTALLGERDR